MNEHKKNIFAESAAKVNAPLIMARVNYWKR